MSNIKPGKDDERRLFGYLYREGSSQYYSDPKTGESELSLKPVKRRLFEDNERSWSLICKFLICCIFCSIAMFLFIFVVAVFKEVELESRLSRQEQDNFFDFHQNRLYR